MRKCISGKAHSIAFVAFFLSTFVGVGQAQTSTSVDVPAELEREVRIVRRDGAEVTEFRDGGVLRAIKVKPDVGPAYYLVDTDGDGNLETRTDGPRAGLAIPMWIILRW